MKSVNRPILLISSLIIVSIGSSQTSTENFVSVINPLTPKQSDQDVLNLPWNQVNEDIYYVDGLGRPIQEIRKRGSPNTKDEVSVSVYDQYGRAYRQYLPFVSVNGNYGSYRPNAISEQQNFFQNQPNIAHTNLPYAESKYEPAPLNRIIEQGETGSAWALGGGHTKRMSYSLNTDNEIPIISLIGVDYPVMNGYYEAGTLFLSQTYDENNHETKTYTDLMGRVICTMSYAGGGPPQVTYNVYDKFGYLRSVLSPMGYQKLTQGSPLAEVRAYCFFYDYDERGRKIRDKIPGADEYLTVYDFWDRAVFTQDGLRRAAGEWYYVRYDSLSRVIETGIYKCPGGAPTQAALQQQVNSVSQPQINGNILFDDLIQQSQHNYQYTNYHATQRVIMEPPGSSGRFVVEADSDYTFIAQIVKFPEPQYCGPLTYTFYDDYDIDNDGSEDATFDVSVNNSGALANNNIPLIPTKRTKGLLTISKARVIHTDTWLTTTYFYDEKGRTIQVQQQNYMDGKETVSTEYSFTGKPITIYTQHSALNVNSPPITIVERLLYDHRERPKKHTHKINNEPVQTLSTVFYNELSQIRQKVLGSNGQQVDMEYNIRGWLKTINDKNLSSPSDVFGMELFYEDGQTPLYNGNISGMAWQHRNNATLQGINSYNYFYDGVDRLIYADYQGTSGYDEGPLSYDANGNILSLKREGIATGMSNPIPLDNLSYYYKGNQLIAVDDAVTTANSYDFNDNLNYTSFQEYSYDANGNFTIDRNNHIRIVYNHLNRPDTIYFLDSTYQILPGKFIHFRYDATGRKLWKRHVSVSNGLDIKNQYAGIFYYTSSSGGQAELAEIIQEEGIVQYKGSFTYVFHLTDHLGNVRVAFNKTGNSWNSIARQDYYPFGMLQGAAGDPNSPSPYRFGFNGQEKDNEVYGTGNMYNAEFWQYDPRIGRRWNIDPVTKAWLSPYHCFSNRPTVNTDPNGATDDNYLIRSDGTIEKQETDDPTNTYYYQKKDGSIVNLGTYDVTQNVSITYKKQSAVKDMVSLEGVNTEFLKTKTVESGNYYLDENVTAALLASAYEMYSEKGKKIFLNQLNGLHGGHSKHGSMGDRIDLQYIRTDGKEGKCHSDWDVWDKANNQLLRDKLAHYGLTNFYSQDHEGSKVPALDGTKAIDPHHHHLHADAGNSTIEVGKYTPRTTISAPQTTSKPTYHAPAWARNTLVGAHIWFIFTGDDPLLPQENNDIRNGRKRY